MESVRNPKQTLRLLYLSVGATTVKRVPDDSFGFFGTSFFLLWVRWRMFEGLIWHLASEYVESKEQANESKQAGFIYGQMDSRKKHPSLSSCYTLQCNGMDIWNSIYWYKVYNLICLGHLCKPTTACKREGKFACTLNMSKFVKIMNGRKQRKDDKNWQPPQKLYNLFDLAALKPNFNCVRVQLKLG